MTDRLLQIRLFGGVTLGAPSGDVIPVSGAYPACLVTTLALHAGRPHARDELTTIFWPDEDQDTARQRFRQTLYALRQQIAQLCGNDSGILHVTRATVSLAPDRIETDVALFEASLAAAAETPILGERLALLERAVDIYRGELAPGIYIEPILAERNRLAEAHLKALHLLAQTYEQTGQIEKAIEAAHRALAANPLVEEAYCDLMHLYSASGQPSAVMRQYQELERILEAELGERPSDTMRTLMDSLRRSGMDRVAARPRNGVHEQAALPGAPNLRNGAQTSSASVPIEPDPTHTVFIAPLPAPARRRWPLALVLAAALAAPTWFTIMALRHRQDRGIPHLPHSAVPAPRTLWERRIPLEPGDGDSEPTAMALDQTGLGVYIVGFVQTAKHDVDFVTMRYDANGRLVWQRRYNGPGNDVDRARSVATDSLQNVFVAGESDNGKGNGTTRLSGLDWATIKYDPGGNPSPTWPDIGFGVGVRRYNGPGDGEDRPCRVVPDTQGGCVVAGYVWDGLNPDYSPRNAAILVDYSAQGRQAWTRRVCGPDDLDCRFFDLAPTVGGVVAAGAVHRRTEYGLETETFLVRYDISGKQRWRRQVSACPGNDDNGCKLWTDNEGNSYVAVRAHNFGQSDHGSGADYLIAKIDVDGNTKWMRTYDGPSYLDDSPRGISVDRAGRVTVTGESFSAPNDLDIATIQYDEEGNQRWSQRFAGAGGSSDSPNDIAAWHNDIIVTGFTSSRRPNGFDLTVRDCVTLKYNANGALIWQAVYDGPAHGLDFGACVVADLNGNAIVTGQSAGLHNSILTLKYAP